MRDSPTRFIFQDRATWEGGKVSGAIYHGGDDLTEVMGHAFTLFALSNPLHPELFPSVRNMEAEVVSWSCRLFNGGDKACGTMSSGGTESILLACRAYREYGRTTRGITRPNMVIPATAHAAFHKAGDYFGIAVRIVPVDQNTFKADVDAMGAAMDSNTVMIMGSAVQFAQGVVDPIPQLAELALKKGGVPLHVDCCLGSFIVPFANEVYAEMGQPPITPFDFSVKGVTSISCDTHKFGYAPKGSSVIMYSEEKYRLAQFYVSPRWTGGVYATPTISGSRAGALVAATWATMRFIGADGYRQFARTILSSVKEVAAGIQRMHDEKLGIKLYGQPDLCVVAFGPDPDAPRPAKIFAVFDAMSARGWQLNSLQAPASVHLCVTHKNAAESAARFESDLREAVAEVDANADAYKDGMGKIYGMAESIPVDGPLELLSKVFLSALYATPKGGKDAEYWWTTKPQGAAE